jgi:hypothetical protein
MGAKLGSWEIQLIQLRFSLQVGCSATTRMSLSSIPVTNAKSVSSRKVLPLCSETQFAKKPL